MKIGVFSSFVVLSHLVLGICTFHDTVYLYFHYVSLRKKEQNILFKKTPSTDTQGICLLNNLVFCGQCS